MITLTAFPAKPLAKNSAKMRYRKETISHFARNNLMREGGKYRYYFFDYLYYRLFILYRKYNEPARFSACGVLCMISLIALFFFSIFLASVLPDYWIFTRKNFTSSQGAFIGGVVSVLCFVAFYLRYNRKRTAAILLKYKGNKWNKIIPVWIILFLPLIMFLTGIWIGRTFF